MMSAIKCLLLCMSIFIMRVSEIDTKLHTNLRIKKWTINEIERTKEDANSGAMLNLFIFVVAHSINERVAAIDELINLVRSMRKFKKE